MYTLFLKHCKKVQIKINENFDGEKKLKNLFSIKKGSFAVWKRKHLKQLSILDISMSIFYDNKSLYQIDKHLFEKLISFKGTSFFCSHPLGCVFLIV